MVEDGRVEEVLFARRTVGGVLCCAIWSHLAEPAVQWRVPEAGGEGQGPRGAGGPAHRPASAAHDTAGVDTLDAGVGDGVDGMCVCGEGGPNSSRLTGI